MFYPAIQARGEQHARVQVRTVGVRDEGPGGRRVVRAAGLQGPAVRGRPAEGGRGPVDGPRDRERRFLSLTVALNFPKASKSSRAASNRHRQRTRTNGKTARRHRCRGRYPHAPLSPVLLEYSRPTIPDLVSYLRLDNPSGARAAPERRTRARAEPASESVVVFDVNFGAQVLRSFDHYNYLLRHHLSTVRRVYVCGQ